MFNDIHKHAVDSQVAMSVIVCYSGSHWSVCTVLIYYRVVYFLLIDAIRYEMLF